MKKYDTLMMGVVIGYIVIAFISGLWIHELKQGNDQAYKVEINRAMNQIQLEAHGENQINGFLLDGTSANQMSDILEEVVNEGNYDYLRVIRYITSEDFADESKMENFLLGQNGLEYELRPLVQDDKSIGYVQLFYSREQKLDGVFMFIEIILALGAIFVIAILLYIRQKVLQPFVKLAGLPFELAKGHLHAPIEESKNKYFGRFIWGISLLQDRLATDKKKELHLEKEKKLMLLSISHDIKTPLNTIKLYAKALEENMYSSEEQNQNAYHQIEEKAGEIESFVKEIVKTSSEDILDIEVRDGEFYLKELVDMVRGHYEEKCRLNHVDFQLSAFENKFLHGDKDRAYEALENIIENAFKYGDGRQIDITFSEEEYCQLVTVHNTGDVITDQDFNHLYDSFFRGSNVEGKDGSGLGLYICKEIMKQMKGDIFAERCEDGMKFTLVFAM